MSVGANTSRPAVAAESMAAQIGAGKLERRDAKTVARARSAVILAFGRALSGAPSALTKALLDTLGVAPLGGPALVFGTERRSSAFDAAMINAVAVTTGTDASIDAAHAAFVVSVFGLCEARATTGQAFLDALIFGAEMSAALAPTASRFESAVLGNVVAATRLLELSPPKIAAALVAGGIAGPDCDSGGRSSLAIGLCLRRGLLAALLVQTMDDTSCAEMALSAAGTPSSHATASTAPATPAARDLLAVRSPPEADLWDQFERQASAVLPRDHIAPLFERLETIDKVTDLATVSRLLQARGAAVTSKKVVFAARGTHEPEETNWVP